MSDCQFCSREMKADICGYVIPVNKGWSMVCTREVGHGGDHVACGTSHSAATSQNTAEKEPTTIAAADKEKSGE